MTKIAKEVQEILSQGTDQVRFEEIAGEEASPLNQPVIEKDIAGAAAPPMEDSQASEADELTKESEAATSPFDALPDDGPLDAPEQEINETDDWPSEHDGDPSPKAEAQETYELPASHARQAADAFLGITDNFLEIGGGFFVKVKKHSDFYDFDEIIEVIDEHNHKNVQRLRLQDEDKALLRPLLAEVLKKRAKKLTPEQQLVGAIISIMVKKVQLVMEVRAENDILVDRIREVIHQEREAGVPDPTESQEGDLPQEEEQEPNEEIPVEHIQAVPYEETTPTNGFSAAAVMEVAEEEGTEQ